MPIPASLRRRISTAETQRTRRKNGIHRRDAEDAEKE
jgi:hypothetical protein